MPLPIRCRHRVRAVFAACYALSVVLVGPEFFPIQVQAADRPNIVLIVSDDQRPDTIAALGNARIRTPNLDRLVSSGLAFTRATCANPICTPSRAEILSGTCSFRNGVGDFGGKILDGLPTLARQFNSAGYTTWYVGKWHNDGLPIERGYDRTNGLYRGGGSKFYKPQVDWANRPVTGYTGWIFQDDKSNLLPEHGVGLTSEISSKFADAAIELIKQRSDKPFLLHVNFTAPHDPLILPEDKKHHYKASDLELPRNFLARHPETSTAVTRNFLRGHVPRKKRWENSPPTIRSSHTWTSRSAASWTRSTS